MISLFKHHKNDHSVCSECQVFFQPYECEDECLNLCPTHRAPVMEKKRRKKVVMYWAERNWEKLEERAIAETTKWKMDEQKAFFKRMTGCPPIQDDLARCNCKRAGQLTHTMCGICKTHDKPRFVCGCLYERKHENPPG